MCNLKLGDLVYDFEYLGMIIAIDKEISFYKIEWYAEGCDLIDRIDEASEDRAERFRIRFLEAKKNGKFYDW